MAGERRVVHPQVIAADDLVFVKADGTSITISVDGAAERVTDANNDRTFRYHLNTDGLAAALGLTDFTPPNQEKASLELIRRVGAYKMVLKSNKYENFAAALGKLNTIWASLPGSPYGQPTHSTARLWRAYKKALAKY